MAQEKQANQENCLLANHSCRVANPFGCLIFTGAAFCANLQSLSVFGAAGISKAELQPPGLQN